MNPSQPNRGPVVIPPNPNPASTAQPVVNVQEAFNVAYVKSLPPAVQKLFTLEEVGGVLMLVNSLSQAERTALFKQLVADGYGDEMLALIENIGWDPYTVFSEWSQDGISWYPPAVLNGVVQPALGEPQQYALPNAYHEGMGLLGPYPTTKPTGWITIPPMAQLTAPGADVVAILKGWF